MSRPHALYSQFNRLNEVTPSEKLQDTELVEALNLIYQGDSVTKRKGIQKVNADAYDANPISRIIDYGKEDQLLVASGTTLRKIDGTVIKDNFANTDFDWEIFSDGKLYLVNGNDFYAYDGTDIVTVVPPAGSLDHIKRCKYIVQRGQRMFAAGDSQHPNSIYFSEVEEPNHFPALNVINAVSDDNDIITGLSEFHEAMVAFKRHHVYAWFGWDPETDVRFDKINVHTGTASHRTIKRVYNHLVYMGSDGVYGLHGLEKNYISSENITDDVIKHRFPLTNACAELYEGKYLLSNGEETLIYDHSKKAWAVWTWDVSDFCVYDGELYQGSPTTGRVYKGSDEYNDDGEAIHFLMTTKSFDLGHPLHDKKVAWFHLLVGEGMENNEIEVTILCDNKYIQLRNGLELNTVRVPGAEMMDEIVPENRTRLYRKKAKMLARSMRVQVTIENDMINEPTTIYGVGFQFWPIRV